MKNAVWGPKGMYPSPVSGCLPVHPPLFAPLSCQVKHQHAQAHVVNGSVS